MGIAPLGLRSISRFNYLMIRQATAIKSINLIAFASISLAPLNLVADSMAPARRLVDDVVGRLISGQLCRSTEKVVGFPSSPRSPPLQKNSHRKLSFETAIFMVRWLEVRQATTTKRRAQNKPLVRPPVRDPNRGGHTNHEAHDTPWFGARSSNKGPGLTIPCYSCYDANFASKLAVFILP